MPRTYSRNGPVSLLTARLVGALTGTRVGKPFTPEMSDASFRRRLWIALGVSLAVNAVIFGSASLGAHYFLLSIRPKPQRIYVTRIVLPARKPGDNSLPTRAEIDAAIAKANAAEALAAKPKPKGH